MIVYIDNLNTTISSVIISPPQKTFSDDVKRSNYMQMRRDFKLRMF